MSDERDEEKVVSRNKRRRTGGKGEAADENEGKQGGEGMTDAPGNERGGSSGGLGGAIATTKTPDGSSSGGSGGKNNNNGSSSTTTTSSSSSSDSGGNGSSDSGDSGNSSSDDEDDEDVEDEDGKGFHQPVTDTRTITFHTASLNEHLTCRLCDGYFRDAHTVVECLHTFCKSCLLKEFAQHKHMCPHCGVHLAANPRSSILADRTLQAVVDKIFPGMADVDDAAEAAFYATRGIALQPQHRLAGGASDGSDAKPGMGAGAGGGAGGVHGGGRRGGAAGGSGGGGARGGGGSGGSGGAPATKKLKKSKDEAEAISFKLAPETGEGTAAPMLLQPLDKPFLRTSGKLKVLHLKKYLLKKLALASIAEIEILCKGETLGQELSLLFISKSRWLDSDQDLELNYRGCVDPKL